MICIFDIETIPDANSIRKVYGYEGDDKEVSIKAMQDFESKTNSSFLPHVFHQVVAISAVLSDEYGIFTKVNSIKGINEEEILRDFLGFLDKYQPKLVSFNGRSFDMPVLMLRALKYNITCKAYFEVENKELNKNKWENYRTRFSDRFHVDLMDSLSEFGAFRSLKLDHVCSMANLPGKYDVSGDQVFELFYENKITNIKEYCESDVLNTYWLYLKYELLKTNLHQKDYVSALEAMKNGLKDEKSYTEIFKNYIDDELERMLK